LKRDTLRLSQHQSVETSRDWNGRYFIAYSGGASVFIRDIAELRRFLKIPKSIPMREALDSWLESLADMDAQRQDSKKDGPAVSADREPASIAEQSIEGSWDPLAHTLDEDEDPTANTKMIT
jgi:hypothetical protein